MFKALGVAFVAFGVLAYVGRRVLYMRGARGTEPTARARALAVRWNAVLGLSCVVAGAVLVIIGIGWHR